MDYSLRSYGVKYNISIGILVKFPTVSVLSEVRSKLSIVKVQGVHNHTTVLFSVSHSIIEDKTVT